MVFGNLFTTQLFYIINSYILGFYWPNGLVDILDELQNKDVIIFGISNPIKYCPKVAFFPIFNDFLHCFHSVGKLSSQKYIDDILVLNGHQ